MFPFFPQKSLSHLLIVFCIIIASCGIFFPELVTRFGLSGRYLESGDYISLLVQVLLFQFLHGGWFHLFLNSYFLYSAGPTLEARMSPDRYTWFFITSTIFVAVSLLIFAPYSLTVGISGFCMAILLYLWIDLYTTHHPAASQILVMLIINIGIGLVPGISLVGHMAGAIWGLIWWQIFRNWRK
ncbi:rhomboid family intramembrane serine protease [Candidatus Gracilibacteria bacterium]|nr:rhomboid family intramembrane serine protease [Candidatus Gracilibacteria bacterium]